MHELWPQLIAAHRECDVLDHPFYRRWSCGALERHELATYAGQYAHVVSALPEALSRAATLAPDDHRAAIANHAREESWHIALWRDFANAVGTPATAIATEETLAMTRPLLEFDSWQEGLLGVYAVESTQAPVAHSKLVGLGSYGLTDERASAYFRVHYDRDDVHAAELRGQLEPHLGQETDPYLERGCLIWRANWTLLDGVERMAAARSSAESEPANSRG